MLLVLHANAQTRYLSLAGKWGLKIDSTNTGDKDAWYGKDNKFFSAQIALPGTMDDAGLGNQVKLKPELKRNVLLHLSRKVTYTGPAWYRKEVTVPADWRKQHIELFLERVIWETTVWVDGKKVNEKGESLVAPHIFNLSDYLTPGKHVITLRIDNRRKYDISLGDYNFSQAYTDDTQIIWNGILGKIELRKTDNVYIDNIQVFPRLEDHTIQVTSRVYNNCNSPISAMIDMAAMQDSAKLSGLRFPVTLKTGVNTITSSIKITGPVKDWDEFNPSLYSLQASLKSIGGSDFKSVSFGFRTISTSNALLKINGRPLFLRGTLECNIFPKEGHAPMGKSGWLKVFKTARSYGLNHLRFHSWCPPEAAFQVADELGFYLQVELPVWTLKIGKDSAADNFLKSEAEKMIRYYGNHPSFCFWSMGNEMQGNMQWLEDEVTALKQIDKRRLYTTTSFTFEEGYGKWPLKEDDYFITQYTKKGWVRGQGVFDTAPPSFDKDYSAATDSIPVPLIIHEMGQYAIFPDMKEIPMYTGVLQPLNLLAIKNDLTKKSLISLSDAYTKASGKLAVILYKEEIERALKTRGVSGFQLLDLHDFPGQGTALVGILNAFWESKGLIDAGKFRNFCSPVVPLIRYPQAVYTNEEIFNATVEVANFSNKPVKEAAVIWTISNDSNQVVAKGKLNKSTIAIGNGVIIGNITTALTGIQKAQKLTITVQIENTPYVNCWNIWVYPKQDSSLNGNVVFTTDYNEAIKALNAGMKVLFNPSKEQIKGVAGKFVSVFWSPVHFPDQPGTMGLLIDPSHPAFADFPTDSHTDWQWWDLCKNATTLVMDSAGIPSSSIILRNVDNFYKNRNMASIIEAKVGNGKLLLCTMDIHSELNKRPVAAQLKYSLLKYMGSKNFNPVTALNESSIQRVLNLH